MDVKSFKLLISHLRLQCFVFSKTLQIHIHRANKLRQIHLLLLEVIRAPSACSSPMTSIKVWSAIKMTIYQENHVRRNIYQPRYAATPRRVSGIFSLMKQWSGSVINLVFHSMIIFSLLYFFLSCLYRTIFIHNAYQKEMFELICVYADRFMSFIPLDFLIGFYVQ